MKIISLLPLQWEWIDQRQEVSLHDTCEKVGSRRDHEEEQIIFESMMKWGIAWMTF